MTFPHPVTARLWEPIQPIARGERYGDPLHAALQDLSFFGADAEDMLKRAEATLRRIPVCQNARVVLRQGHPSLLRRELRLPRH